MDPQNKADFDDSLDQLARIRNAPSVVEKVDSVVSEVMPLIQDAAELGVSFGLPLAPGGGALVAPAELALHVLGPVIQDRVRKWLESKIPPKQA